MQGQNGHRTIHANANEHEGYWQLRVTFSALDEEGTESETLTWRQPCKVPSVDSQVDQTWILLIMMAHLLEREGAVGRVSSGDWPGLW